MSLSDQFWLSITNDALGLKFFRAVTDQDKIELFKDATAATLRALARQRDVDVYYSAAESADRKLSLTQTGRARLPFPGTKLSLKDRALLRGAADGEGLRLRLHNAELHRKNVPKEEGARAVYDALEQARMEAIGAAEMRGVGLNLQEVLSEKSSRLGYHNLKDRPKETLADALHILAREGLTGEGLSEGSRKLADLWRPVIEEKLGKDWVRELSGRVADQMAFSLVSKNLLGRLGLLGDDGGADGESLQQSDKETESQEDKPNQEEKENNAQSEDQAKGQTEDQGEEDGGSEEESGEGETQQESEAQSAAQRKPSHSLPPDPRSGVGTSYNIFTTEFDEVVKAEDLADFEELYRLRELLDKQMVHLQPVVAKLANRLQRKLLARQTRSWKFDLEEGYLDSGKLARVIANPTVPLSFKQERETEFKDTVVCLLLDNSGSMRGRPISIAAMCADVLARTLERCGIKVEILGFTTRAWKGGKSRDLWIASGRPPHPGRLNDIRHIIYKAADVPYRRTRKNLGLMLKEGLLKENIDGEALAWAYNRLAVRSEDRKILMVISDGAPVDDSTLSVNPTNILENDLRHVINWIELIDKVDLTAIGIGHDVTRYYRHAMMVSDVNELGEALINDLSGLFEKGK
ncbi:MAG: cobaltochelatase subunit CobT [Alphaproteobacteria bacterium]|nr:cobaltochelatase subunit CobT [Alphaproteobacteria bacterium]